MKRFTATLLVGLIIALPLYGCDNNVKEDKNRELAVQVTKNFVDELEKDNLEGVKLCYTPDLSEATDILKQLEGAGTTALTDCDSIDFVFDKITKCSIDKNIGKIITRYNVNIENTPDIKCIFKFEVEKIDGNWYLTKDPEINSSKDNMMTALTNAETIELAIKECMFEIATKSNSLYNGYVKYIDPENTEKTLPDAISNYKEISVADVAGAKNIYEAFKPVIYNGTIYKPYWVSEENECMFLDSTLNNINEDGLDCNATHTITQLVDNGIPSENAYIIEFDPFGYFENQKTW